MRLTPFLATLALTSLARTATLTLPTLISCEPADIRVISKGNYTIEGRESTTRKLVFRAHIDQGINLVTWDAVDLPANSTAVVSVLDQISTSETALVSVEALVLPNPSGNTTCLVKETKKGGGATKGQKNMVPTIIGIVLGAFFVLVLLLVGGMMYRRKKEKAQKLEDDSVDLNHAYVAGSVPAGGNYMARLVPGLKLQEAKPLPRDYRLEREQQDYASTRRGTRYYKGETPDIGVNNLGGEGGFELPNYNAQKPGNPRRSSFHRRDGLPSDQSSLHGTARGAVQAYTLTPQQQAGGVVGARDPFASQPELPYHQHQQGGEGLYQQNTDWHHSQSSF